MDIVLFDDDTLPRSNKHGRKRPYMEKYDEIHGPVLRPVYLRVVYGETRRYTEKKNGRLRSLYTEFVYDLRFAPYFGVYDRISLYTSRRYTERNTGPYKTPKYNPLRSFTDVVYDRKRPFTDCVTADLG